MLSTPNDNGLVVPQHPRDPVVLRLESPDADRTPADEREALAVFVGRGDSFHDGKLPIAGRHERDGGVLTFTPTFAFAAGEDYVVRTQPQGERRRLTEFNLQGRAAANATVTAVYPSGDVLPENVLRFYVHFSVPMAPHVASRFIRLRDVRGVADDAAFMQFKQELWNADRTRLTVLMDPGRIKRGVATNLDLGPALLEGNRYTLTVDAGWRSADGSSVLPAWSKPFKVTAPLRERPDVGRWSWTPPRPGTRDTLTVRFDRPFDRHLVREALHIATNDGRLVEGTSQVGEHEASWSFIPDDAWPSINVRIIVDDALEDVTGNNFRELLDQNLRAVP